MRTCSSLNASVNSSWESIPWKTAEQYVNRLQLRIVKAVTEKKWNRVKRLQYLLVHSWYAKALAVKRVSSNKGKQTPGVDQVVWNTPSKKYQAVHQLSSKNYTAKPLKRVYIRKYGKKEKRPLSIPTMKDRAMQALHLMALEPIAETTGDRTSFGFRKNRSAHDAMAYMFRLLSRKASPQWVVEGDIKGCFDNISHSYILTHIPLPSRMLRKWIQAGYIFHKEFFPTIKGTAQGGIVSPTVANMVLDGMEQSLGTVFWSNKNGVLNKSNLNKNCINLVRYADDFIVTARTKEAALQAKECIQHFLAKRGLELSDEKTHITHIDQGFDFLGWNFRKYHQKLLIKPSKKSIQKFTNTCRIILQTSKSSTQKELIRKLNFVIRGWRQYHQPVCAKQAFKVLDHRLWYMLWRWARRRHRNKGKQWIQKKYWKTIHSRKWVFMDNNIRLLTLSEFPIVRHIPLILTMNPFLEQDYFMTRKKKQQKLRSYSTTRLQSALLQK
jgi:RNA-directed DNA polymerase